MYTLLKNKDIKKATKAETLSLFSALIITEILYHFGSFILECAAFFATWYILSFIIKNIFSPSPGKDQQRNAT